MKAKDPNDLIRALYLGYSVYVGLDRYNRVVLMTYDGREVYDYIALEEEVVANLLSWLEEGKKHA